MASLEATTLLSEGRETHHILLQCPLFKSTFSCQIMPAARPLSAGCEWRGSLQNGGEITRTYHDDQIRKTLASVSVSQDDFYA